MPSHCFFIETGETPRRGGTPPANASPQAVNDFQSNWSLSYMKNFQDNCAALLLRT
jgi:hypothetical protein